MTFAAIAEHFTEVKVVTLNYNLQALLKEGFILKPKRGVYQRNPQFQSVEQKRQQVEQHIATNGSRIQGGKPWAPGVEPLTETINPVMFAFLARTFGESIVERMKSAGFTKADVGFVESLLARMYPIKPEHKTQAERAWHGITASEAVVSNGRGDNGSS